MNDSSPDEGWRQIRAGVALVNWSKLVHWDRQTLSFTSVQEDAFESATGHRRVHRKYGRLICWITFAVGAEYICKGVCLLKGRDVVTPTEVIRLPYKDEDLQEWIRLVNSDSSAIRQASTKSVTLGKLPVGDVLDQGFNRDLVIAGVKLLASTIRNRDAHWYAENVRAFHFHAVQSLFVPAVNILLASLDQAELRGCLSGRRSL